MIINQTRSLSKDRKVNKQLCVVVGVKIQLCALMSIALRMDSLVVEKLTEMLIDSLHSNMYNTTLEAMLFSPSNNYTVPLCRGLKYKATAPAHLHFDHHPTDRQLDEPLEVDEEFVVDEELSPSAAAFVNEASKLFGSTVTV